MQGCVRRRENDELDARVEDQEESGERWKEDKREEVNAGGGGGGGPG